MPVGAEHVERRADILAAVFRGRRTEPQQSVVHDRVRWHQLTTASRPLDPRRWVAGRVAVELDEVADVDDDALWF